MARKVDPPATRRAAATPAASEDAAGGELALLAPDLPLALGGRQLLVREYGFLEGLRMAARAPDFIADLLGHAALGELQYTRVRHLIGQHAAAVVVLVAHAIEPEDADAATLEATAAWVRQLGRTDSETLFSCWFAVNVHFFLHEAAAAVQDARVRASLAAGPGRASLSGSAGQASATSRGSSGTPSAS